MPKAPEEQMACSAWSFWASKHQEQGQGGRQEGRGSWGSAGLGLTLTSKSKILAQMQTKNNQQLGVDS